MYSLKEIFALFEIDISVPIRIDQIKLAKRKVLMTHPDKSRLPPEYFLFYKRAFEIVAKYFTEQERQHQEVPKDSIAYSPTTNDEMTITDTARREFQEKFNRVFDENMARKIDPAKNAWFSTPNAESGEQITMATMAAVFESKREKQHHAAMTLYRGVQDMAGSHIPCTTLYDDMDDEENNHYVSSDPFSKLKFDDLRKVHKDQTIFAVGERDLQQMPAYSSVDHYLQERKTYQPLEKNAAEMCLAEKETQRKLAAMQRQHAADIQTALYERKNKEILSSFLRLT